MLFFYMHGAATRVAAEATAFAARRTQWDFDAIGQWADAGRISHSTSPGSAACGTICSPTSKGSAYVNHLAADDAPEKIRASYGTNHRRLSELKTRYDPTNLFRVNANITPA